jgi:hypothetical protein
VCIPCWQTNDDAITVTTMPVILDITSKHYNPQGCEVPATCVQPHMRLVQLLQLVAEACINH